MPAPFPGIKAAIVSEKKLGAYLSPLSRGFQNSYEANFHLTLNMKWYSPSNNGCNYLTDRQRKKDPSSHVSLVKHEKI